MEFNEYGFQLPRVYIILIFIVSSNTLWYDDNFGNNTWLSKRQPIYNAICDDKALDLNHTTWFMEEEFIKLHGMADSSTMLSPTNHGTEINLIR